MDKTITVGIDAAGLLRPETGIGRYTAELIRALDAVGPAVKLRLLLNSFRSPVPSGGIGPRVTNPRVPDRLIRFAWNRLGWPPVESFLGPLDVFHASDWVHPPTRAPLVATVHDLGPLDHPEWYADDVVTVHQRVNRSVCQRASTVITVSEFTRRRFLERFDYPEELVRTIHLGVTEDFSPQPLESSREVARGYGLEGRFLLYVGTRERRKNVVALLEILRLVREKEPDVELALVGIRPSGVGRSIQGVASWIGRELEDEVERLGLAGPVHVLGHIPKGDMISLLSAADVFVFPSLYEGFGLPVLEAMACGLPVVAADRTATAEVVEGAGLLVDPDDPGGFAAAVLSLLGDPEVRKTYRRRGLARARGFSWANVAERTLQSYRLAMERAGR